MSDVQKVETEVKKGWKAIGAWITAAMEFCAKHNIMVHAVGFALIGVGVAAFFTCLRSTKAIGDCVAAAGAFIVPGVGLVTAAQGWSK
jgi:hypothetical protein